MMRRRHAVALILLSALSFGSTALFAKLAYASSVSPSTLLALRFLMAVAMLTPVIWFRRIRLPRGQALATCLLMGALYTAQSQCYFTALLHASSGLVGLLVYIYPVLVALLTIFLGWEKLERRTLLLLTMTVSGIAITLGGNLQGQPLGIVLSLLAAVVYAVYIVIGDHSTRDTDPLATTFVVLAAAALGNSVFAVAGGVSLPHGATAWLAIAVIALFSTVIASAAFLIGIKHIGSAHASIISTLEPVITLSLGAILLRETISANQLIGGALVLTAVILLAQRPTLALVERCAVSS